MKPNKIHNKHHSKTRFIEPMMISECLIARPDPIEANV